MAQKVFVSYIEKPKKKDLEGIVKMLQKVKMVTKKNTEVKVENIKY